MNRATALAALIAGLFALSPGPAPADPFDEIETRLTRVLDLLDEGNAGAGEQIAWEAVVLAEENFGPDSEMAAHAYQVLGGVFMAQERFGEALPYLHRAFEFHQRESGMDSLATLAVLSDMGISLVELDRAAEAEGVFRLLIEIFRAQGEHETPRMANAARWLGSALGRQGRRAEAEIYLKQTVEISEKLYGADDVLTALDTVNLGVLYSSQRRYREGGPLLASALAVLEAAGTEPRQAVTARAALAFIRSATGDAEGAALLLERNLAEMAALMGPGHPDVVGSTVGLARHRLRMGDLDEAGRLAEEAFAAAGPASDRQEWLRAASLRADIRFAQGRADEALALYEELLERIGRIYGDEVTRYQSALGDVGRARFALGDYAGAREALEGVAAFAERIADINAEIAFTDRTGRVEDAAIAWAGLFDALVKTYDRIARQDPSQHAEMLERSLLTAQRVIDSQAARALAQMAARQGAGDDELAALVRERQDLVELWQRENLKRTEALSPPPAERDADLVEALSATLAAADARIRQIDGEVAARFPGYAALQAPAGLTLDEIRSALSADEVLLFYADNGRLGEAGFETYLWAVPKEGEARWIRLERGPGQLSFAVESLRGLLGVGPDVRGAAPLAARGAAERTQDEVLAIAAALHGALLSPVADMIAGRDLLIVPSASLAGLPFHLLVSQPPEAGGDRYRDARWLVRDHAIAMLPSVSSLAALQASRQEAARDRDPYLGFANPLLTGPGGRDRRAFARAGCGFETASEGPGAAAQPVVLAGLFRGAAADVEAVRALAPLPETVDEACAVAAALGSGEEALRLGAAATEAEVKRLSQEGTLERARIVHFATHGLVSGELSGLAEPAIVLTPPPEASPDDDGLLTASEVSMLKLAADWVILSACNTAAGDGGGEALSGLARAFFYAGARALMVSHWPVNSDAAVRLATGAIDEIAADPALGRAEALRRSMVAEIERGGRYADPANWAPFVLVGTAR